MKPTKAKAWVVLGGSVIACFFGLGLWDRSRIQAGKEPFLAHAERHTDSLDVYRSLLYFAEVDVFQVHISDRASRPHQIERLRSDEATKFRWKFWTLGLALLFTGLGIERFFS